MTTDSIPLDDEGLIEILLSQLPELASAYDDHMQIYAGERMGAHIVYGDVLAPALLSALRRPRENEEFLRRAFQLLEHLLTRGGPEADNVVSVSVCEMFVDDAGILASATLFMGPEAARVTRDLALAWGVKPTLLDTDFHS